MLNQSMIILFCVLVGIAIRKYLPGRVRIWMIMLIGAVAVVLTQQLTLPQVWHSIDFNIIGFLLGVFIIGQALEECGIIDLFSRLIFKNCTNQAVFLLVLIVVFGLLSALLMNDTLAIITTPLLIRIARHNTCSSKPLLLASAFAITIGSVMSPIGNPQNLLIAIQGLLQQPFTDFIQYLAVPTFINLIICWFFILIAFRRQVFKSMSLPCVQPLDLTHAGKASDQVLCYFSLLIMIILIFIKIIVMELHARFSIPFSSISLLAALPIVIGSKRRLSIITNIDWGTLVFFIAMFIVMRSVWNTGVLQSLLSQQHQNMSHPLTVFVSSVAMSQLISNVPFVALYLPLLLHVKAGTIAIMALAAGSTLAGNFLPLGAASNIIIMQQADNLDDKGFGVIDFIKIGVPLGCVNVFVYYLFLH